jgi:hypothetical protein
LQNRGSQISYLPPLNRRDSKLFCQRICEKIIIMSMACFHAIFYHYFNKYLWRDSRVMKRFFLAFIGALLITISGSYAGDWSKIKIGTEGAYLDLRPVPRIRARDSK